MQACAARTLVYTRLAAKRLKRSEEILTSKLPEREIHSPAAETRIVVLNALGTLPPKSRAVVVLRYWADLSVDQVAAVFGCSPGNVESQSARALDKLRTVLDDIATEYGTPDHTLSRPIKVGIHPYAILIAPHGCRYPGRRQALTMQAGGSDVAFASCSVPL